MLLLVYIKNAEALEKSSKKIIEPSQYSSFYI